MGKHEKLKNEFLSKPKNFTYQNLKTLLSQMGYKEIQESGSRVCFVCQNHKIKLHKPHPGNILKQYQIKLITEELQRKGKL